MDIRSVQRASTYTARTQPVPHHVHQWSGDKQWPLAVAEQTMLRTFEEEMITKHGRSIKGEWARVLRNILCETEGSYVVREQKPLAGPGLSNHQASPMLDLITS